MSSISNFCFKDVDGGGKFVPVGEVGPGQTSLAVKGLKNKGNYKFRVKAVNKEGESEPLATDKHYLIKGKNYIFFK